MPTSITTTQQPKLPKRTLQIVLPAEQLQRVRQLAKHELRSYSAMGALLIQEALDARESNDSRATCTK